MCSNKEQIIEERVDKFKLDEIDKKVKECEVMSLKIKAMQFVNFQSFDFVYENYQLGEVYMIEGVGYTIITKKTTKEIGFIVIMGLNNVWLDHWQDVDKHILIKQGVYLDLYTGKEYKQSVSVPKFTPTTFKAIGDKDLVLKGRVFKD